MKLNQDEAKVLREVVAAIPQVADVIASFPPEHKVGALEAAEGGYVRAMLESGFAEPDAKKWAAAVMRRLRNRVAEHDAANGARTASAAPGESNPIAPQAHPRLEGEGEAQAPPAFHEPPPPPIAREFADEYAEPPPTRPRGLATFDKQILTGLPNVDDSALEKYAALMGRWRAALPASTDKRGLWLATALSLGIAAGLVVSAMENATFQPYFVGLFVSIGIWLLLVSLPQPPKSK